MADGDGKLARELAQELGLEIFSPRLTDWGNAQRLVSLFGGELRYCHLWHKWLVWDGRRWAIDETGAAVRKVKRTIVAMHQEADNADDEEFNRIYELFKDKKVSSDFKEFAMYDMIDAGRTEVKSGTRTVLGFTPMYKHASPKCIQDLSTLK